MTEPNNHSCCSKMSNSNKMHQDHVNGIKTDLVCGMEVHEDSPHFVHLNQHKYLFCSQGCKGKFELQPEKYLNESKLQIVSENSSLTLMKSTDQVEALNEIDPVCGMTVRDPNKPHMDYQDKTFYFCNPKCLDKFQANPESFLKQKDQKSSCCGTKTHKNSEPKLEEQAESSCCGSKAKGDLGKEHDQAIDPVCGMSVDKSTNLKTDYQNQTYYFCHVSCLDKFKSTPEPYLIPMDQRAKPEGMDDVTFTCPMDPEIVQQGPGTCPICGMALEPMQPSLDDGPNPELVDFSHRFWMTLPLTLLVFVLAMGSHIHAFIPQHIQPWIELVLSIPVVLWAGKPFIERCWVSYKTRNLNMWSLIGVGILAAFIYSVVATVFPTLIPMEAKTGHGVAVYFEAACMIVSLSL